jgi:hypothetical protein
MMIKFIGCLLSLIVLLVQGALVQAAEVEVKWSNAEKYRDIDAGEEHRKHFKDRLFKSFEEHFASMAASLPENQKLVLDITDVDLAGDVNHGGMKRIRIVKDIFFPRMDFSYQLLNADNKVVKSAEVSLKDMGFLMHNGLRYRSKSFGYEKEMLDNWFKKTFENEIVK